MSLHSICTRPVVIVRRARQGPAEPYGEDELVVVGRESARVHLHQRTSDEPNPGAQETNVTRWALTGPPEVMPRRDDLVEVEGELYELDGDPFPAWSPLGQRTHHVEAVVVQVTG